MVLPLATSGLPDQEKRAGERNLRMIVRGRALFIFLMAAAIGQPGCAPDSPSDAKTVKGGETGTSPALALSPGGASGSSAISKEFYMPKPGDFRVAYDKDAVNKTRQAWEEYYGWVKTFYSGNLFESGWTKRAMTVLEGLHSERVRDELRANLNELSKVLAGEWAKDNSVRMVDNSDLRKFGSRFLDAKAKDDGSGSIIRKEIAAVRSEVESRSKR